VSVKHRHRFAGVCQGVIQRSSQSISR
jgi:hypothetical protein